MPTYTTVCDDLNIRHHPSYLKGNPKLDLDEVEDSL